MYERVSVKGVYTPDEMVIITHAFDQACAACDLTGAHGRQRLAKSLLQSYRRGRSEAEMVRLAEAMIWQWRGLRNRRRAATRHAAE
ncbi:MAG TPA: hypothetical protein VIL72_02760 [Beijerinckiaceae bacterium]|jgi:hypothetical protein